MNDCFKNAFAYTADILGANVGTAIDDAWLNRINAEVDLMCKEMLDKSSSLPNTDVDRLQGWINEIWHQRTFNAGAKAHHSTSAASIPDPNGYASPDSIITDGKGEELKTFSLKSDNGGSSSGREQAKTPWEEYCKLKNKAEKNGKEYQTFEEYLKERNIENDNLAYMSKYYGQGKVVNKDMLEGARRYILEKYANSIGNDDVRASRYKEVLDTLTDVISDGKGEQSIPLSHDDAVKLAEAAKKGDIDKELLEEVGLDVNKLVTAKDIGIEAFKAGMSAMTISLVISLVPVLIEVLGKVMREEDVSPEDLKRYGLRVLSDSGRGLVVGSLTGAIYACCKTGKFGKNLLNVDNAGISILVVVIIGTISSAIKLATKSITKGEMARELMQLYTTTGFAFIGGTVLASLCDGFPLAYMLGSFIGSVVGSGVFWIEDRVIISLCREYGCTFFGLVDQDYTLPDEILDEMGVDRVGFQELSSNQFVPDLFEFHVFSFDEFTYDKFAVNILSRDLIGIYKIGYVF